jgi:D-sedoheptulose 7-phosphate isomerase
VNFDEYCDLSDEVLRRFSHEELTTFVESLRSIGTRGGILWVMGNGGSAATASHLVADFNKTAINLGGQGVRSISVSELVSLSTAFANDVDFEASFSGPLGLLSREDDAIFLISVSGTSPNIVKALNFAKDNDIESFAMFGIAGESNAHLVDHLLMIDSKDYQIVENTQLSLIHWITKSL